MGTSRSSAGSQLRWEPEEASEAAALAEFANEAALRPAEPVQPPALQLAEPVIADVPLPARRRLSEAARALLLASITTGALAASFALGFGYVGPDRAAPAEAADVLASKPLDTPVMLSAPARESRPADALPDVTSIPAPTIPSATARPQPASSPSDAGRAVGTATNRAAIVAVRHTLERYQQAFSRMDVGAMLAMWPSLDAAAARRQFAGVERQALELDACRVTTAGDLATAVCSAQLRYVARAGEGLQARRGTWTIALERQDAAWRIAQLNRRDRDASAR